MRPPVSSCRILRRDPLQVDPDADDRNRDPEQLQGGKSSAKSAGDGSGRVNHHPGGGGGK